MEGEALEGRETRRAGEESERMRKTYCFEYQHLVTLYLQKALRLQVWRSKIIIRDENSLSLPVPLSPSRSPPLSYMKNWNLLFFICTFLMDDEGEGGSESSGDGGQITFASGEKIGKVLRGGW